MRSGKVLPASCVMGIIRLDLMLKKPPCQAVFLCLGFGHWIKFQSY